MAKNISPRKSLCCDVPVSRVSSCSDFCPSCHRRISAKEYYEMHNISLESLEDRRSVFKILFKRIGSLNRQKLERNGSTKCCGEKTEEVWFDLILCSKCNDEIECDFEEAILTVRQSGSEIIIDEQALKAEETIIL